MKVNASMVVHVPDRVRRICAFGPAPPSRMITTMTTEQIWIGIGLLGEAFFGVRLVLQWIATERQKRSVFPMSFWLFSVAGDLTLLSYAVYRLDPVFIIAEGIGLLIYARNLYFVRAPTRQAHRRCVDGSIK